MQTGQDIFSSYLSDLKRRKAFFVVSGLVCIPASIVLSYVYRAQSMSSPWIDILFFGLLLIPSVSTYLLATKFFSRTKSVLLATGMFIPTVIIQAIILFALWAGINRALSAKKPSRDQTNYENESSLGKPIKSGN